MSGVVNTGDTCFYYPVTQALFGCMSSDPADHSDNESAIKAANFMGYLISAANSSFETLYNFEFYKKNELSGALNTNLTRSKISSWEKEYLENLPSPSGSYTMYYLYGAMGGALLLSLIAIAATVVVKHRRKMHAHDLNEAAEDLIISTTDVADITPEDSAVISLS